MLQAKKRRKAECDFVCIYLRAHSDLISQQYKNVDTIFHIGSVAIETQRYIGPFVVVVVCSSKKHSMPTQRILRIFRLDVMRSDIDR